MARQKLDALDAELTLWDLADPEEAAAAARDLYGARRSHCRRIGRLCRALCHTGGRLPLLV